MRPPSSDPDHFELRHLPLNIDIFTDCLSAASSISRFTSNNLLALTFQTHIAQLGADTQIRLHWVPGHRGVCGNEAVADNFAKEAAQRAEITTTHVTLKSVLIRIRKEAKLRADAEYNQSAAQTPGSLPSRVVDRQPRCASTAHCFRSTHSTATANGLLPSRFFHSPEPLRALDASNRQTVSPVLTIPQPLNLRPPSAQGMDG
eukprot:GHVS01023754.1.p1 GENE.GHVS01023754.1~~GHVS01023754.1.p1  ORF type:complete len:203 (+),score=17.27 GHVS01023754.1:258-866(+)